MTPVEIRFYIKMFLTALGTWLAWFIGRFDGIFYTLMAVVSADYITGLLCAVAEKKLSSEVGFKGIARKVFIFTLVGVANLVDIYILKNNVLRTLVGVYYIANEALSITENAIRLGLPVPKKLKDVLVQLKNKGEDEDGSIDKRGTESENGRKVRTDRR